MNGFDGLFGFGVAPSCMGLMSDRAGLPLSSHHFLLSELAGGKPGSIESYPIKSSSSVSIVGALAVEEPTSARRVSYISLLKSSRMPSSTMLTTHWKVA